MNTFPKKKFGQHFLKEVSIAERICDSLQGMGTVYNKLLEIGPGPGVLTKILYPRYGENLFVVEIDQDMIPALQKNFPLIKDHIFQQDFLELPINSIFKEQVGIIGNFPYNISSQILFKVVENRALVPEMVGMFQREVAQRVTAEPGNKIYGLISVWVQVFYDVKYLFTVNEGSFNPPPKVKSGVIRLERKQDWNPGCNEELLLNVIKHGFNQRRKTLRNALSLYKQHFDKIEPQWLDKRAEQLSYQDFIMLAKNFEG
jgi:16S rRNA (adenine1518-N6/adenine1519-N6)-dimethyltransferase